MADMRRKGRSQKQDQKGEANNASRLTEQEVSAIRAHKGTYAETAAAFKISMAWAWQIRNNKAWAHIGESE